MKEDHYKSAAKQFLLLFVLVFCFTACKKDKILSEVTELRVLNYFDTTGANISEEIPRIWETFERENPDIKLIREDFFNEPFHEKTESSARMGVLPDVVYCWPSGRSTTLHTRHLLKNLEAFVQRDGLSSVFVPVALDPAGQASGYLGMIPGSMTATNAFFINLEVLNDCGLKPAKTYAELKAQVPVLKAKGYETILMANKDAWVMQSCLFSLIAGRFCGDDWEKNILAGQAKFTDPDFVAALNFIKTMYDDGVLSRETLNTSYGDVVGQFATNKGAYYIDGDWRVGAFITDASTGQALISPKRQKDIIITVFPNIDGVKFNRSDSVTLGTGWGMSAAIPAESAKEEAAWRLIKWLSSKEILTFRVESGGIPTPARSDIDFAKLDLEPMQIAIASLGLEYNKATVVIDAAFDKDVCEPVNNGLQDIGRGTKTPQEVARLAQAALEVWMVANRQ